MAPSRWNRPWGICTRARNKARPSPFNGCKSGSTDYFISVHVGCEGARILGTNGYGYAQPVPGLNLVPLYRCSVGGDDFVSKDEACEGKATGQPLGYALP